MITYKNITDVEVLENVPENAMALVNDGGELKQVACSRFGGGSSGAGVAMIHLSVDDNEEFHASATWEELAELYNAGYQIRMFFDEEAQYFEMVSPARVNPSTGLNSAVFSSVGCDNAYIYVTSVLVNPDNSVEYVSAMSKTDTMD